MCILFLIERVYKKYNDTVGNRTRDLPACSAVPQQTAQPGAPEAFVMSIFKEHKKLTQQGRGMSFLDNQI
jgi:hypothetical protein